MVIVHAPMFHAPTSGVTIRYTVRGSGRIDVLLLAPGGMQSCIEKWNGHTYDPWTSLPDDTFRVIAMDQRNANHLSRGHLGSGWDTFRDDQLSLLDHVQSKRCLLVGSCIGPSFALNLMKHSPHRFPAAVLLQPIGLAMHTTEPEEVWEGLNGGKRRSFVHWSLELEREGRFSRDELDQLHEKMYGSGKDFDFSVDRSDVATLEQPLLVFMGKDRSHPSQTSRDIVSLAQNATLVESWRDGDYSAEKVDRRIEAFLVEHGTAASATGHES